MSQLTLPSTCKRKTRYLSGESAKRAVKRRNKAAGWKYLRKYRCDVCNFWHVTTQILEDESRPSPSVSNERKS